MKKRENPIKAQTINTVLTGHNKRIHTERFFTNSSYLTVTGQNIEENECTSMLKKSPLTHKHTANMQQRKLMVHFIHVRKHTHMFNVLQ